MLAPYIESGMTVLEVGPAMGFFTIPMAVLVGDGGCVIAADLQPKMLAGLRRRATATCRENIIFHQCRADSLCLEECRQQVDFTLIFWMLHEVPDAPRLIKEVYETMLPRGRLLFVEPWLHVRRAAYDRNVETIEKTGFDVVGRPEIAFSFSTLFCKR
jgi:ubiquinone/menaquinone biosynthesis C-methylase UbiE